MLEQGDDPVSQPPSTLRSGRTGRKKEQREKPPSWLARRGLSGDPSCGGQSRPSAPEPISGAGTNMQMMRRYCRSATRRGWWGRAGGVNWANQVGAWRRGGAVPLHSSLLSLPAPR
jgi:hypothetical protein